MNNKNDRNGHQPALPQQKGPPTVSAASSASDQHDATCKDFVWGICSKGAQCRYRHELNLESMKSVLKFTDETPMVLRERSAATSTLLSVNTYELVTQPPLPPNTISVATAPPPPLPAPLPNLEPPPLPAPPTVTTSPMQVTPPISSADLPLKEPACQSTQPLPRFDTSKPSTPLPIANTAPKNGALKKTSDLIEAGPSKLRKQEASIQENGPCDNCIQRERRIEGYKAKLKKLESEQNGGRLLFEKKKEEYDNGVMLLKSAVSPELFRVLDNYVEGLPSSSSTSLQRQNVMDIVDVPRSSLLGNGSPEWMIQNLLARCANNSSTSQRSDMSIAALNGFGAMNGRLENGVATTVTATSSRYSNTAATAVSPPCNTATLQSSRSHQQCATPTTYTQSATPSYTQSGTPTYTQSATPTYTQSATQSSSVAQHIVHPQSPQAAAYPQSAAQPQAAVPHAQNAIHSQSYAQSQAAVHPHSHNMAYSQNVAHAQSGAHPQMNTHMQGATYPQVAPRMAGASPSVAPSSGYVQYQATVLPPHRPYYQYPTTSTHVPNAPFSNAHIRASAANPSNTTSTNWRRP